MQYWEKIKVKARPIRNKTECLFGRDGATALEQFRVGLGDTDKSSNSEVAVMRGFESAERFMGK